MIFALALLAAQASAATRPVEQDRLVVCLDQARRDPASAILSANAWFGEATGAEQALPYQCLGQAYVSLLRWGAAELAFRTAADLARDALQRAKLAAMAGSAALPEGRYSDALALFDRAQAEARAAGDGELGGTIAVDRARALVGLEQLSDAAAALAEARAAAPQYAEGWLLSATLARRQGDLERAGDLIAQAGALDPENADIALEAGVVAVLTGDEANARKNWQAVMWLAPDSAQAATAKEYLAQIEGARP